MLLLHQPEKSQIQHSLEFVTLSAIAPNSEKGKNITQTEFTGKDLWPYSVAEIVGFQQLFVCACVFSCQIKTGAYISDNILDSRYC